MSDFVNLSGSRTCAKPDKGQADDRLAFLVSIVSLDREELVAEILTEEDLTTLEYLAKKGTPANSLKALVSDLTYLEAWCLAATRSALPWPAPESLAFKFIAHHLYDAAEQARDPAHGMPAGVREELEAHALLRTAGPHSPATVRRRLSTWTTLHRLRGMEAAIAGEGVREAVKRAAKAADRRPGRKSRRAIVREIIEDVLDTCRDGSPAALRDRALFLLAFASGGRRRSEIASLRVDQLIEEADVPTDPDDPGSPSLRCICVELGDTKTTTAEERASVVLVGRAAEALTEWLESEKIADGYVFRPLDRWENVGRGPITPEAVNLIVKRRLALAGYDPLDYSAHGLRSGYLTQAGHDRIPLQEAMAQSQHRSVQQAARYYNDAQAPRRRAARLIV